MTYFINANGQKIEDPFTDETGRFQVNPKEYYKLTNHEMDTFLFHQWYEETHGKALHNERTKWIKDFGKDVAENTVYVLRKRYEKDWQHVREQWEII